MKIITVNDLCKAFINNVKLYIFTLCFILYIDIITLIEQHTNVVEAFVSLTNGG